MKQIRSPKEDLHSMKILPLRNNGNISASTIYLFIENDVIERRKHHFHTSSVEKYFQNYIMKYTLT